MSPQIKLERAYNKLLYAVQCASTSKGRKHLDIKGKCEIDFTYRQLGPYWGVSHTTAGRWLKKLRSLRRIKIARYRKLKYLDHNGAERTQLVPVFYCVRIYQRLIALAKLKSYKFIKRFAAKNVTLQYFINKIRNINTKQVWRLRVSSASPPKIVFNSIINWYGSNEVFLHNIDLRRNNLRHSNYKVAKQSDIDITFQQLLRDMGAA